MAFDIKVKRVFLSRLARQFGGVQPFSVLDTKDGLWQERKREWIALGIQSELGRGESSDLLGLAALVEYGYRNPKGGVGCLGRSYQTADPSFYSKERKRKGNLARCFGQDLMRGEHKIGRKGCLTTTKLDFNEKWEGGEVAYRGSGTSIFDPTLCEIIYHWFCPNQGTILDPFAGGSVRGIVAAIKEYHYTGIDLRQEQIEANLKQWEDINNNHGPFQHAPKWLKGCATEISPKNTGLRSVDLIFTCPPYGNLEIYSDNPQDLSTMDNDAFDRAYVESINRAYTCLKPGGFACYVVGDYRNKHGFYRCFPELTVKAALEAGYQKYNEAILLNAIGSLPVRAGRVFKASRKLGKCHQNVLIFYKGTTDPKQSVKLIEESYENKRTEESP